MILGSTEAVQMLAANERVRKEGTQQPSGIMQSLSILYLPPIPTTAAADTVVSAAAAAPATSIAEHFPMEVGANFEIPLVQRKRQLKRTQILKGISSLPEPALMALANMTVPRRVLEEIDVARAAQTPSLLDPNDSI